MVDIKEIAIAYWRMERWLKITNVERKMAAKSALRVIKRFLDANGIEIFDLQGQTYSPGLSVEVINREVGDETLPDEKLKIIETVKPIIMENGTIIQFGQIVIGDKVKKTVANNEILSPEILSHKSKQHNENSINDKIEELKDSILKTNVKKTKSGLAHWILACFCLLIFSLNIFNTITLLDINKKPTNVSSTHINTNSIENKLDTILEKINSDAIEKNEDAIDFEKYTVKKGDSLEGICKKRGIDYNQNISMIKSINNIYDVNRIMVGQIILLPLSQ